MIQNYTEAEHVYKSARNPDKGKPLSSWLRMYRLDDGTFRFSVYGTPILTLSKDNVFTFIGTEADNYRCAITLGIALYRFLPFAWHRINRAEYKVSYTTGTRYYWTLTNINSAEVHQGLQFNINTKEFSNLKPNDVVDKDKRKVWLRKLKIFRTNLGVRCKLGVVQNVGVKLVTTPDYRHQSQKYKYDEEQIILDFATCIESEVIKTSDIENFILLSPYWFIHQRHELITATVEDTVNKYLKNNSKILRRYFGVLVPEDSSL